MRRLQPSHWSPIRSLIVDHQWDRSSRRPGLLCKAHDGNRTHDLFLTKEVLCRLSYVGILNDPTHYWSGKRDSNPRPRAWKARALPTELFPLSLSRLLSFGGEGRIRTSEGIRRQIYSLLPLAAREPLPPTPTIGGASKSHLSRWRESNSQPTDYKSVALPLSYIGPDLESILHYRRTNGKSTRVAHAVAVGTWRFA